MSSFTKTLQFEKLGDVYQTSEEFIFYLITPDKDYVIVPSGTIFNGASIPKIIQKISGWDPIDERWLQATVLHDALVGEFCDPLKVCINGKYRILSWTEAANWFSEALKVKRENSTKSCPPLNRELFVLGVKIYSPFRKKIKKRHEKCIK